MMPRRLFTLILVLWAVPALAAQEGKATVSADSAYALARAAYEKEDFDHAKDLMEQALKENPNNCEYHYLLGNIQGARAQRASIFSKFGNAKSCKHHFEQAVEFCPDSIKYLRALLGYHRQAPGIAGGDKKEAARLLDRIFVLDSSVGFWEKAGFAVEEKDFALAENIYQAMLQRGRDTVNVLSALGSLAFSQSKDYMRARAYYLRASAADPGNQSVNYQLARLDVLSKQNPREAIDRLHDYTTHPTQPNQPDYAAAYWRMGMAYELVGNPDSARLCYQSSLQLRPGYEDAKKSLDALRK